jgi:hypothetical protein
MEVDANIPQFLAAQKSKAPANLQNYYNTFEDLYERKYVARIVSGIVGMYDASWTFRLRALFHSCPFESIQAVASVDNGCPGFRLKARVWTLSGRVL